MKSFFNQGAVTPPKHSVHFRKHNSIESPFVTIYLNGREYVMLREFLLELPIRQQIISSAVKIGHDYFLENDYDCFVAIIDYFRHGELHIPKNVCINIFKRELNFWELDSTNLETCCYYEFARFNNVQSTAQEFRRSIYSLEFEKTTKNMSGWQSKIYAVMNYPTSSKLATIYRLFMLVVVIGLLTCTVMHTALDSKLDLSNDDWNDYFKNDRDGLSLLCRHRPIEMTSELLELCESHSREDILVGTSARSENCEHCVTLPDGIGKDPEWVFYMELNLIILIAISYMLSVFVAPEIKKYLLSFVGLTELMTILHYCVLMLLTVIFPKLKYEVNPYILVFSAVRVALLIDIARSSRFFYVVSYSVFKSTHYLFVIMCFFLLLCAAFSIFLYSAEFGIMKNLFNAYWSTVGIMTTNAFDYVPHETRYTTKILGGLLSIAGITVLVIVVPVFENSFGVYFNLLKYEDLYRKEHSEKPNHKPDHENAMKSKTLVSSLIEATKIMKGRMQLFVSKKEIPRKSEDIESTTLDDIQKQDRPKGEISGWGGKRRKQSEEESKTESLSSLQLNNSQEDERTEKTLSLKVSQPNSKTVNR